MNVIRYAWYPKITSDSTQLQWSDLKGCCSWPKVTVYFAALSVANPSPSIEQCTGTLTALGLLVPNYRVSVITSIGATSVVLLKEHDSPDDIAIFITNVKWIEVGVQII